MIKVISAKAMAQLELTAYNQGYSSSNFMENVEKVVEFINKHIIRLNLPKTVLLLCGKGNNAGDAFVAAIHLLEKKDIKFMLFNPSQSKIVQLSVN